MNSDVRALPHAVALRELNERRPDFRGADYRSSAAHH
jgi:hypothetical protein